MNWNQLKVFYWVASAKSISKAANKLNVTQSAISRHILNLENRLGVVLFHRRKTGVVLTEHGKELFKRVKQVAGIVDEYQVQLKTDDAPDSGSLKVIANVGLVSTWVAKVLPDFIKEFPDITLSIIADNGELDFPNVEADVALAPFIPDRPKLIQKHLMSWHRKLYASRDYLEKYGTPQTVEDLDQHRLIGFGSPSIYLFDDINWHLTIGCSSDMVRKPHCNVNSVEGLFELGNAGVGIISFSQESLLLKGLNLVPVLPEVDGPVIETYFSYPKSMEKVGCMHTLHKYLQSKAKDITKV